MLQNFGLAPTLFITIIFYVLPFILAIILPAWLIPQVIKRIFKQKKEKLPSLLIFTSSLALLAFFANLFWQFALYNKVYYEWDRIFLPYTFLWHESPAIGEGPNWLAEGWQSWHLPALWLTITVLIYITSAGFAYLKNRKHSNIKKYKKILIISVATLTSLSLILPQFRLKGISSLLFPLSIRYQEVDTACSHSDSLEPRILYSGVQQEFISDLFGNNLEQAFESHLQLKGPKAISPDSTKVAILWDQELWIHCINTNGAFKIELPEFEKEVGSYHRVRSFPSWSPDSKLMIMNNNGDLLLIDTEAKTTQILKSEVALRDNNIDLTAKDRDTMIAPFERGDAYWSANGNIYYTSFFGDNVSLHQLNWQTKEDLVVKQSSNLFNIVAGDPTGNWLFIYEYDWPTKKDKENPVSEKYFFNTQTKSVVTLGNEKLNNLVWSPSGKLIAQSASTWQNAPKLQAFPATIINLNSKQSTNVTEIVRSALDDIGIETKDKALVVQIKDFLEDSKILLMVKLPESGVDIPQQINSILDLSNGELTVLQDYPGESFQSHQGGRMDPVAVVK